MYAAVIINVPSSNVDQEYEYGITLEMQPLVKVGVRVSVPFGNGNRVIMGYIIRLYEHSLRLGEVKMIEEILDMEPVLTEEQLSLARYIQEECICPLIRILNLMIPEALHLKTYKYVIIKNYQELDADLALLFGGKTTIAWKKTMLPFSSKITRAIKQGILEINYEAKPRAKQKLESQYACNPRKTTNHYLEVTHPKDQDFLLTFCHQPAAPMLELLEKYDISPYRIQKLCKQGYLEKVKTPVSRVKVREIVVTKYQSNKISPNVQQIIGKITSKQNNKPLLWIPEADDAVLEVIQEMVLQNNQKQQAVLVVCADILSSYKYATYLHKMTGLTVACINSQLSVGEYYDLYQEIKNGEYAIIVTTSKGALLPYQQVGTVFMIDVESDQYYNDQSPRYDLKKVMQKRSDIWKCPFVMISYVPNITELCYGLKDHYQIIDHNLHRSFSHLEVVDLKEQLKLAQPSLLSQPLLTAIEDTKAKGKQTLLLLNNKGYSAYVQCRFCGEVKKCPKCDIALQYSKKSNMLICPACSTRIPYQAQCSTCGSTTLKNGGIGMEQIQEELQQLFPNITSICVDNPTYSDFSEQMMRVEDGEVDVIIVGDVYAKAVYDKQIALVGHLHLDTLANAANYDANAKAYQSLVFAGKHLHANPDGKMIIQTYEPNRFYLTAYITNDFNHYLKEEIAIRNVLKNEPFYHVERLLLKGINQPLFDVANAIKKTFQEIHGKSIFIIGPTYSYKEQAVQVILKHRNDNINTIYQKIYQQYQSTPITLIFDKYPKYL